MTEIISETIKTVICVIVATYFVRLHKNKNIPKSIFIISLITAAYEAVLGACRMAMLIWDTLLPEFAYIFVQGMLRLYDMFRGTLQEILIILVGLLLMRNIRERK